MARARLNFWQASTCPEFSKGLYRLYIYIYIGCRPADEKLMLWIDLILNVYCSWLGKNRPPVLFCTQIIPHVMATSEETKNISKNSALSQFYSSI